jgi:hypothetical protein
MDASDKPNLPAQKYTSASARIATALLAAGFLLMFDM